MFPGDKMKAFTFSYDDGVREDRRFLEIINRYGLKCTFNLNSAIQNDLSHWNLKGHEVYRMNPDGLPDLYRGHEIACHGATHADFCKLSEDALYNELTDDRAALTRRFGETPIGAAYPFGTFDEKSEKVLRSLGFLYCRTIKDTHSFDVPENLLTYHPTAHHGDAELFRLAEDFIRLTPTSPKIFYVWGHAYEFEVEHAWDRLEEFCRLISGKDDIFYGTNREIFECL